MGIIYKKRKYKLQGGGRFLLTSKAPNIDMQPESGIQRSEYVTAPTSNTDTSTSYRVNFPFVRHKADAVQYKQNKINHDLPENKVLQSKRRPITKKEAQELNLTEQPILSLSKNPELIDELNRISPGRFSKEVSSTYDKYDNEILSAVNDLEKIGEAANPNIIKSIMLIETGMRPRKNKLGYEGFPQTKSYIVDGINNRFGTNFTMDDMYDPKEAAKFIHYYLKDVGKSRHVNTLMDSLTAYNWGLGNLAKSKRGERTLPRETHEYLKLANTLLKDLS